jgi:regulator of replication initiation timing
MAARFIYNVWLDMVVSINQLKAKDGELSFKIRQLTIEVNTLRNENSSLKYEVTEFKDEISSLKYEVTEFKDEISTLNIKLNELKHDNSELATELEYLSEKIARVDFKNVSQIEELWECVTEKFEQLSYASVYMGPLNGAFPMNSTNLTLRLGLRDDRTGYLPFLEYEHIVCFYNLKTLEIDWDILRLEYRSYEKKYLSSCYPVNENVTKLILQRVSNDWDADTTREEYNVLSRRNKKNIFESFPNLEELVLNIGWNDGPKMNGNYEYDLRNYCNPSTKLNKIVFNETKYAHAQHLYVTDYTQLKDYYSSRGVEVVVNVILHY